jgi:glycosyltransferase involved in cell wall biosynthesis
MRIGIDIRKYADYGIGTYIQNLIRAFESHNALKQVYFAHTEQKNVLTKQLRGEIIVDDSPKYSIRELTSISAKANKSGVDLFHAPHYTLPVRLTMPSVVTIHDIIHLRMKEYFSLPQRAYAYAMLRHACASSSAVIVDSTFGKQELIDMFPIHEEKIHVIHLGVQSEYYHNVSQESIDTFKTTYSLQKPFVLYTGSMKPHKNVPTLLKAIKHVSRRYDVQLLCTGESILGDPTMADYIARNNMARTVISLGWINSDDLRTAYHAAAMVVLPSFYEGFGFSVLEAMASGTPAIGARAASIPEVMGTAGLLFDPNDEEDLAAKIETVLTDSLVRESLIAGGNERSRLFSWDRCADQTLQVYRKVV